MFTGIITELGRIERLHRSGGGIQLTILAPSAAAELEIDDSIAINGVCQTVVKKEGGLFTVEAVEETLRKTTFSTLRERDSVNLELPLRLGDRLGGHLVLGHVDGVGSISSIETRMSSSLFTILIPKKFEMYLIPTGSITVDGVSLTAAELRDSAVAVSIIPHTMEKTIFGRYDVGSKVNLEFDMIGKYVQRLTAGKDTSDNGSGTVLTEKHLRELGF